MRESGLTMFVSMRVVDGESLRNQMDGIVGGGSVARYGCVEGRLSVRMAGDVCWDHDRDIFVMSCTSSRVCGIWITSHVMPHYVRTTHSGVCMLCCMI